MKIFFAGVLFFSTYFNVQAQSNVIWSEDFNQSSSSCDPEDAPFSWNVTDIGVQGSDANYWYIDTTVNCNDPNTCYTRDTSHLNRALYIGIGNICDSALWGAVYKKGCDNTTEKRVESPTIDCSGHSNLQLDFDYMAKRHYLLDVGILCFSDDGGSTWSDLSAPLYSGYCPTTGHNGGYWKHYSVSLPSSASNNPNVKIGFHWQNNDDCLGLAYSIAVDNLVVGKQCYAAFTVEEDSICPGTCTSFSFTSIEYDSLHWYYPGGSLFVDSISPTVCYNLPGNYSVSLVVYNGACSDSIGVNNQIYVFPYPPPQGIIQSNDTLYANSGAASYQWYYNGNPIAGATNYYLKFCASGDYNVVATDTNGCEVEAVFYDAISCIDINYASSTFSFTDSCTIALDSYQWYYNGTYVSSSSIYLTTDPGNYYLVITYGGNTCYSKTITIP